MATIVVIPPSFFLLILHGFLNPLINLDNALYQYYHTMLKRNIDSRAIQNNTRLLFISIPSILNKCKHITLLSELSELVGVSASVQYDGVTGRRRWYIVGRSERVSPWLTTYLTHHLVLTYPLTGILGS